MLILIAGVTGNIGKHAARHALNTSHSVRGLGRSPSKLPSDIKDSLESFVVSNNYYDIAALDTACSDVDAIVCAYSGMPELHLDAQLLLLRAAERAGVKRFLAAGWNYDWRNINFGDEPVYDAAIAFHAQAAITSSIRPCHIFSGMLVDVFFGEYFLPGEMGGVWDGKAPAGEKNMDIWGTGDELWNFTTEEDAGKWGVEVVTAPGAEDGGFVSVCSFSCGLNEVKSIYERVRGLEVKVQHRGSVEDLEKLAVVEKEKKGGRRGFWDWHRLWFHLFSVTGRWNLKELQNDKFPNVKATGLDKFLKEHPNI